MRFHKRGQVVQPIAGRFLDRFFQVFALVAQIVQESLFTGIVPTSFVTWDTERARRKGLTIKLVRRSRHGYERTMTFAEQGKLDLGPFITHRFPIEQAPEAFEVVSGYRDNVIKAVIVP